jgi:ABC-type nitrate/sulfonate/bicarbonate transport system substrate-binding protein
LPPEPVPPAAIWEAASRLHEGLHPTLDADRLALFEQQKKFLFTHGFLDADFALDDWIDPRPLEAARAINARTISPELV